MRLTNKACASSGLGKALDKKISFLEKQGRQISNKKMTQVIWSTDLELNNTGHVIVKNSI